MGRQYSLGVGPQALPAVKSYPWWLRYLPGRIQFLDDFEGVLKWELVAGVVTKYSGIEVFEGTNALSLVTGAVAGNVAQAQVYLGYFPKCRAAFQMRWHALNAADTTMRKMQVRLEFRDGVNNNQVYIQYLKNLTTPQNKWQLQNPAGTWDDIPGAAQNIDTTKSIHHFLRLVADLTVSPPLLLSFESDNLLIENLAIALRSVAAPGVPYINMALETETDVALASTAYFDALCLSDREP